MKAGDRAVLVFSDGSYDSSPGVFPKIGEVCEVLTGIDSDGDVEVMFALPCPVESPEWIVPAAWLVRLPPDDEAKRMFREAKRPVPA